MPYALGVRITDPVTNRTFDRVFPRLPVRIGRNVLNDLQLDHNFVSQFHAVLELQHNRLMLRDLGSTNGTTLADRTRVPPNQLVDLSQHGFGFSILSLTFQTYTADTNTVSPESRRRPPMGVTSMLKAPPAELLAALSAGRGAPDVSSHKALYSSYRVAWDAFIKSLSEAVAGLDPAARRAFLERAVADFPGIAGETDFQRLASQAGLSGSVAAKTNELDAVAVQGLKELAAGFMPTIPAPETAADMVRFLGNLQECLDVFLKCFIPLRDGHKQFEADLDLRASRPIQGVEAAATPQQLAAHLLDHRHDASEAARAVESTFADVMIHQVAMLNGVMRGVKSLLSELSPENIERVAQDPRNRSGLDIGPYRYRSLWNLYQKRHQDLADEEKQLFRAVFGGDFAEAYGQFQKHGAGAGGSSPAMSNPHAGAAMAPAQVKPQGWPGGGGGPPGG